RLRRTSRTRTPTLYFFSLSPSRHTHGLRSFPTRRSSDLTLAAPPGRVVLGPRPPCPGESPGRDDEPRVRAWLWPDARTEARRPADRKSTRLNSSHVAISYAVFCLKKKKITKSSKAAPSSP